jgi:hypothetical protein
MRSSNACLLHETLVPLIPVSYGFVKIYGSRLMTSSLWDETPEARLVFLSLLAIADRDGFVDVPNEKALARVLNLPPDYLERALVVLMAPDDGSRNKAFEGRRVLREGSGWLCVSYKDYRDYRSPKQEATRERVARWRAGKAGAPARAEETPEDRAERRELERLAHHGARETVGEEDFERP